MEAKSQNVSAQSNDLDGFKKHLLDDGQAEQTAHTYIGQMTRYRE